MLTNKEFENDIYYFLKNRNKINRISFFEKTFNDNINLILPVIGINDDSATLQEGCAYLLGKASEMAILEVCRPSFCRVWVSPEELMGDIVTNLPNHLNSIVIEMMDGCENAVDKYLEEESDVDSKRLLLDISLIAEMLVKKYKIYDIQVEGYTNKEIAFPSEIYNFANSIVLKELELSGYKIVGYEPNFNSPLNMVLERDGEKLLVLECVTIEPVKAKFIPYLRNIVIDIARKDNSVPCCLAVMVSSKNDDARSKGVVTLKDENNVRRTEIIRL